MFSKQFHIYLFPQVLSQNPYTRRPSVKCSEQIRQTFETPKLRGEDGYDPHRLAVRLPHFGGFESGSNVPRLLYTRWCKSHYNNIFIDALFAEGQYENATMHKVFLLTTELCSFTIHFAIKNLEFFFFC